MSRVPSKEFYYIERLLYKNKKYCGVLHINVPMEEFQSHV